MVEPKTWEEFRASGLLWFINTILHMFGYAICLDMDGERVTNAYPARVKFRGFAEQNNTDGYIKVTSFLKENIDDLLQETKE